MAKINVLDIDTVNKIAAGEVVERPASAIKEMIENSIDSGATAITIEIKNGGISFMRVTDNGCGIESDDVERAFLPHSTSKITSISDLTSLYTMGFRGEALASISSVAKVDLITKTKDEIAGTSITLEGGKIVSRGEAGCPEGTTIVVKELFFNTPARMNFLKKDVTEASHINEIIDKMVLGHPEISFRFINNGREVLFSPGNGDLTDAFSSVYGSELAKSCLKVDYEYEGVKVFGLIGTSNSARANRNMQNFYVNGRWVRSKTIMFGAEDAYKTMLMTGKYPILLLNLKINSASTDVNVHPSKLEIKFVDDKKIRDAVFWGVQNALFGSQKEKEVVSSPPIKSTFKKEEFVEKSYNIPIKPSQTIKPADFFTQEMLDVFKRPANEIKKEFVADSFKEPDEEPLIIEKKSEKYSIIGQVFNTYIIIEKEDKMMMIDQHAAHERIKYEELVTQKTVLSQVLMMPETISLGRVEGDLLNQNQEIFKKFGFEIEQFGNTQYIVRQVPSLISINLIQDTILELLDLIKELKKPEELYDKGLFMVACKSAIKANQKLSDSELNSLVKTVMENDRIRTCPHGRPVIISFDKKYIEKEFKRIV